MKIKTNVRAGAASGDRCGGASVATRCGGTSRCSGTDLYRL